MVLKPIGLGNARNVKLKVKNGMTFVSLDIQFRNRKNNQYKEIVMKEERHPKMSTITFHGYHANQLHDNSRDIQQMMERLNYLEEWYERGTVSRQLVTLCVVSIWFTLISVGLLVLRDIVLRS
jgi:hypothetical protein